MQITTRVYVYHWLYNDGVQVPVGMLLQCHRTGRQLQTKVSSITTITVTIIVSLLPFASNLTNFNMIHIAFRCTEIIQILYFSLKTSQLLL